MGEYYILDGRKAVPATLEQWAVFFEKKDARHVAKTDLGGVTVSTVFLGANHQYGDGPPLLFETMVFGGPYDQWQDRCSTWDEAVAMHEKAVDFCKIGVEP